MTAVAGGTTPSRAEGARLQRSGGRIVLSSADGSVAASVNESAAAVFELCDGATTVDEMVGAICEVSSIPRDRAREDVLGALGQLARLKLVVIA